jgi:hypothetical protein
MGNYVKHGAIDFRAFDGARASGISFRLANGRSGEIVDPTHLRMFYTRLFYADQIKNQRPTSGRAASKTK